jgi:enamine deaminase RidA (YjgF/YER057c/UK114 family)
MMSTTLEITRAGTGARMSQAVTAGGLIFLSGQVADVNLKSVGAQTINILETIDRLLAEMGSSRSRLISATIWLSDISTFEEMNAEWDRWVTPGRTPARATVEAKLASPKYLVEIAVVAA